MEDTLRGVSVLVVLFVLMGLNPCFNGRYSQSYIIIYYIMSRKVLILVLMEDTLRASLGTKKASIYKS